jgi:predicted dienelactone hydrolase
MVLLLKNIFTFFGLLIVMNINSQPFNTGHTRLILKDPSRNNRRIPVEVYYPSDSDGKKVQFTSNHSGKFPLLCFGHGFVMKAEAYNNIRDIVVPEGFIIAFPKTERGMHPSHPDLAKDLSFVIHELQQMGQKAGSLFFDRIGSINCAMGHSMGGGAAVVAAQMDPAINAIALFSPYDIKPSAIAAAESVSIPALIFAGDNDCVTPPVTNQIPLYKALKSNDKTLIIIKGGDHCQMADSNFLCNSAEATCRKKKSITETQQHEIIRRYLLPWLKSRMMENTSEGDNFNRLTESEPDIEFHKTEL